jgi:hypothetical protein
VRLAYDLFEWRLGRSTIRVGIFLGSWIIGGYAERGAMGLDLGPIGIDWESDIYRWIEDRFAYSWRIFRFAIRPLRLVIRFKLTLNIWRIGFLISAPYDHVVWFGPFSVQIEYSRLHGTP